MFLNIVIVSIGCLFNFYLDLLSPSSYLSLLCTLRLFSRIKSKIIGFHGKAPRERATANGKTVKVKQGKTHPHLHAVGELVVHAPSGIVSHPKDKRLS